MAQRKFITHNNVAVAVLTLTNTGDAPATRAVTVSSPIAATPAGDELTRTVNARYDVTVVTPRLSGDGMTVAGNALTRAVTLEPGRSVTLKVQLGATTAELPDDYQSPVSIEGVLGYNNAIQLTQPMHMQDLKYFRDPLYAYGNWVSSGETSKCTAFTSNPGSFSWGNTYEQYTILGESAKAAELNAIADRIRDAIMTHLWDPTSKDSVPTPIPATRAPGRSGNAIGLNGTHPNQSVTRPAGIMSKLNDFTVATWVNLSSSLGNTTQNWIGKSQYGDPGLAGSVDDFRIYDRALSAAEIRELTVPANVASYQFDEAGGASALDSSGNGRHGVVNTPLTGHPGKVFKHTTAPIGWTWRRSRRRCPTSTRSPSRP